ncbi:MAG: hypothetical protein ACFFCS_16930 [Candidatus Hodarchaeota archaeon]
MAKIYIDSEIWSYALKKPKDGSSNAIIERYTKAKTFLLERITNDEIFLSLHQLHELFHILSFRGNKLPPDFTKKYLENLTKMETVTIVNNSLTHFKKAMERSILSGIHIWDFLCVIPLVNSIEIIYSCDKHFDSDEFKSFKKPIMNPIGTWFNV